jgi:SpoVK/Ycf46/Vps4 family AAA+-type ATPase
VIGQAEAKAALFNAVRLSAYTRADDRACAGVLLFGPPGCSKTMLARAVAQSSGLSFLAVSGSTLLGKYVGDAERAVASLFRRARATAPAVVFIDEADAIAASRDDGPTSSRKRLLNQLLQEMQGVQRVPAAQRVIVIAATNRPDVVDTALTRAGRLDRMVLVRPPTQEEGAQILAAQLRLAPGELDQDAVAARVVKGCNENEWSPMRSGADFAAVGRLARQLAAVDAVEGAATCLTDAHVEAAWARVQPSIDPAMLRFYTDFQSRSSVRPVFSGASL